jgi:hypothetical protein
MGSSWSTIGRFVTWYSWGANENSILTIEWITKQGDMRFYHGFIDMKISLSSDLGMSETRYIQYVTGAYFDSATDKLFWVQFVCGQPCTQLQPSSTKAHIGLLLNRANFLCFFRAIPAIRERSTSVMTSS